MHRRKPLASAVLAAVLVVGLVAFAAPPASADDDGTGGSISGTVTSSVGGRLTQPVIVYARLNAGSIDQRRSAWADELTGKYTIDGLPPGDYIVKFSPLVTDIFTPQYEGQLYDGVHLESQATVLDVTPGGSIRGVDASMEYIDGSGVYDPTATLPCSDPRNPASRKAFAQEFELRFGSVHNVTKTNVKNYLARCAR